MATKETTLTEIPPIVKIKKHVVEAHIWVRFLATVSTLAASCIILTAKQSINLFGIAFYAKYSYSSVFKFFAIANLIACGFSVVSMFIALIPWRKVSHPTNYFYMFLHALVVMALLMGGCAAATAIGYVGRYGNSHTGWLPICDHFAKFCSRVTISVALSYLSFFLYLALSIISANKSRQNIIVE